MSSQPTDTLKRFLAIFLVLLGAALSADVLAQITPLLRGAEFGYEPTHPLNESVGPNAVLTPRYIRGVGGVALVRIATGSNGWSVAAMKYDASAEDGQRLVVTLSKHATQPVTVRPSPWDWKLIPLVRFVDSEFDAAFSFLYTRATPLVGRAFYHPAFKDTLLGLRLMQLDIFLSHPTFVGYVTDTQGGILLGPGESESIKASKELHKSRNAERERASNEARLYQAWRFLKYCLPNQSIPCGEDRQSFQSYIVGDTISPTSFSIVDGKLKFESRGLC